MWALARILLCDCRPAPGAGPASPLAHGIGHCRGRDFVRYAWLYKAIAEWVHSLGPKALARFGCRRDDHGHYLVPSESIIRDVLIRVDPEALDHALQQWNAAFGQRDESLAIDGKTMCNAIDAQGQQTHVMSVVGHASNICYTQKKSVAYP